MLVESIFIEICNPVKTTTIIGCIYKHPNINVNELNDDYLNELLDKLSKENKIILLLGDLNINQLQCHIQEVFGYIVQTCILYQTCTVQMLK